LKNLEAREGGNRFFKKEKGKEEEGPKRKNNPDRRMAPKDVFPKKKRRDHRATWAEERHDEKE